MLKKEALNRDNSRFRSWHSKVREAVPGFTPKKNSAFDEITFASDFFLSKLNAERININDRIDLRSDF